jgi:hypothetical protein
MPPHDLGALALVPAENGCSVIGTQTPITLAKGSLRRHRRAMHGTSTCGVAH